MPTAVSSNGIKCQSATTGKPVDAVIVVFDDGSTKVLCPAEKSCKTAGLCSYERVTENAREPAAVAAPEETDPIGSVQREQTPEGTSVDAPAVRDPIGSVDREESIHEMSDEQIFY